MSLQVLGQGASIGGVAILSLSFLADVLPGSSPGFGSRQVTGVLAGFLMLLLASTLKARSRSIIGTPTFVVALSLVALGLILDAVWIVASAEEGADFTYDQTTGPAQVLESMVATGLSGIGICRCLPDKVFPLDLPGELETEISIYQEPDDTRKPAILLVHGNTWRGQSLSTYRILATLLAQRGYVVATFDKLGFGRSDDPFSRAPCALEQTGDRVAQTQAAIEHLRKIDSIDPSSISVLGHSAGVREALMVGLEYRSLSSIIVMPAPPAADSGTVELTGRFDYFVRRYRDQYELVYGRSVPDAFSACVETEVRTEAAIPWELYRQPGHIPLLVLLGEHDQPSGHAVVHDTFVNLAEPKEMVVIQRSDHYVNTAQSLGLVFYDRGVARQLTDEIDSWLQVHSDQRTQRYFEQN